MAASSPASPGGAVALRLRAVLRPLLPLFVIDVLTAFTVGMVPPLLPLLADEWRLSPLQAGLVNTLYAVGRLGASYPASAMRAREGTRAGGLPGPRAPGDGRGGLRGGAGVRHLPAGSPRHGRRRLGRLPRDLRGAPRDRAGRVAGPRHEPVRGHGDPEPRDREHAGSLDRGPGGLAVGVRGRGSGAPPLRAHVARAPGGGGPEPGRARGTRNARTAASPTGASCPCTPRA